jgi:hypothetical protein
MRSLVHHRRQPARGQRRHAVPVGEIDQHLPGRLLALAARSRAGIEQNQTGDPLAAPISARPGAIEWPTATIGPSLSASAASAMAPIWSSCEKSATTTSAWG